MKKCLLAAGVLVFVGGAVATYAASTGKAKVTTLGMVVEIEVRGRAAPIPPNREVPLPAGEYKVKSVRLHAKGVYKGKPVIWRIDGTKPLGKLTSVEVAGGETTTVEGGEPLTVKTPVRISKKGSTTTVSIDLQYIGQARENYRSVVYRGRVRAPSPKIQIVGESGNIVVNSAFQYGYRSCCDRQRRTWYSWRVPPGLKGTYTIKVLPNLGPFKWTYEETKFTIE